MSTRIITLDDPHFEALLREWLDEWDKWCKEISKQYTVYTPESIQKQKESFKLWMSQHKNIIVLDMYK